MESNFVDLRLVGALLLLALLFFGALRLCWAMAAPKHEATSFRSKAGADFEDSRPQYTPLEEGDGWGKEDGS